MAATSANVIHLMGALRPSGMERMLVSAARHWAAEPGRHLVVGQGSQHPFRPELEAAGYRVTEIPSIKTIGGWRALRRLLALERSAVLHVHTEGNYVGAVFAAIASRRTRIVRTVHNVFPVRGKSSWSRRLQARVADPWVAEIVAPSQDVALNERRIGRSLNVVLNWVAAEFFDPPSPTQGEWVVIVGNASAIKNHVVALRAIVRGGQALAYVGSEDEASVEEKQLLDLLSAEGRLVHRGPGDPLPWLVGANAFLMSSLNEGMPVALAEALQIGLACVIADAPGLRWAANIEGVVVVPSYETDDWVSGIAAGVSLGRGEARRHPDFSPARGAAQYQLLYDGHAGRAATDDAHGAPSGE